MGELDSYREKRDFRVTPEPRGGHDSSAGGRFVIHKHDATSLHYDFRLEVDGVLESWAVPKGPSTDPSEQRLALATEPHPLEYLDFEGVVPEGEYGAGPVLVWDTGSYRNDTTDDDGDEVPMVAAIADGHVSVWLDGEKVRGGYALTGIGGDDGRWLLVKKNDDEADARRNPTSTEPASVLSGRTLEEIVAESDGGGAS